jgi:hypothetical protein
MNAIAAISEALLRGEILTIKTAFKDFGVTNLPREVSRGIEKKFGVIVSRVKREGVTRYKIPCYWYEYRLNPKIDGNSDGMKLMRDYISSNGGKKKAEAPANADTGNYKPNTLF